MELEGNEKHVQLLLKVHRDGDEQAREVTHDSGGLQCIDDRTKTEAQKVLQDGASWVYRRGTALAVYMSQDRPDLSAAACQFARRMRYNCKKAEALVQTCERFPAMRSLLSMAARGEYQREVHHGL